MSKYRIVARTDSIDNVTYIVERYNGLFFGLIIMSLWSFFGEYQTLDKAREWVALLEESDAKAITKSTKVIDGE